MKIAHISDLHIDVAFESEPMQAIDNLIDILKKKEWDRLLISGDISNSPDLTLEAIEHIIQKTGKPVHFVPGNHDLRTYYMDETEKVYDKFLLHPSNPIGNPVIIDDSFAIVGGLGWYDYSYGPEDSPYQDFDNIKDYYWWDGQNINWKETDPEIAEKGLRQLEKDLEATKGLPTWVMTHFVPYSDFLVYKNPIWNMCNAYMGAEPVGRLLDTYPNVKFVSFGHTHKRFGSVKKGNKTIIVNPMGYPEEWKSSNFKSELEKNLLFFEI